MSYKEVKGDLFTSNDNLAHCVSQDLKMGLGIAKTFKDKFGNVDELIEQKKVVGQVAYIKTNEIFVFYLITKEKYYQKPTYRDLEATLENLKELCDQLNVKSISMPKIACGLDKLNWTKVKPMIQNILSDLDITIYTFK